MCRGSGRATHKVEYGTVMNAGVSESSRLWKNATGVNNTLWGVVEEMRRAGGQDDVKQAMHGGGGRRVDGEVGRKRHLDRNGNSDRFGRGHGSGLLSTGAGAGAGRELMQRWGAVGIQGLEEL